MALSAYAVYKKFDVELNGELSREIHGKKVTKRIKKNLKKLEIDDKKSKNKPNKKVKNSKNHTEFPTYPNDKTSTNSNSPTKKTELSPEANRKNPAVKLKAIQRTRKSPIKQSKGTKRTILSPNVPPKSKKRKVAEASSFASKKTNEETSSNSLDILESEDDLEDEPPLLVPIEINENQAETHESNGNESDEEYTDTAGLKLFKWLINPVRPTKFFGSYWERECLYVDRGSCQYYKHILTTERLDRILREHILHYTRNVDVVSYQNGVKEVFNQEGRAVASALWDYYANGCSIRILNPQTYNKQVHLILATLQEYFGTMVGANVYLTPPGSQGFAPHFDDIEAFIIQLEGKKHWKLYKPKKSDTLARDSSPNFTAEDLDEPFMEVTVKAGDLLYFPRGVIHEGRTDESEHSLHITISVYQRTAYADLLENILPLALKRAATDDIEFRQGLPLQYLKHVGHVNQDNDSATRNTIITKVKELMNTLIEYIDVDEAADQLGRKFMHDSMPPVLSEREVNLSSRGDGDILRKGKVLNRAEFGMDTDVRLLRYHCLRLVEIHEETTAKIYYCTENAKFYHGEEEQFVEIDKSLINAVKVLQNSFPEYVQVENLPVENPEQKIQLVSDLWERGLLVTKRPLTIFDDE